MCCGEDAVTKVPQGAAVTHDLSDLRDVDGVPVRPFVEPLKGAQPEAVKAI